MQKPETARDIVMSLKDRFRPEKAEPGYETVFHLDISGDRGDNLPVTPSPAGDAGKTFDVAIDLPPGLDFVASANKGVTYDPA